MQVLTLKRFSDNGQDCLGLLLDSRDIPIYTTLELSYRGNLRNISSIPTGLYEVYPHNSPKFGRCFSIADVPNRDHILIHSGNIAEDTEGCILIGELFAELEGGRAVINSKKSLNKLLLDYNEGFHLLIK